MTMRSCTDRTGVRWEIFEVHPAAGRGSDRMPEAFRLGWLCFQSPTERRRLAPVPVGWQTWGAGALLAALDDGNRFSRRTPPELRLPPQLSGSHESQP